MVISALGERYSCPIELWTIWTPGAVYGKARAVDRCIYLSGTEAKRTYVGHKLSLEVFHYAPNIIWMWNTSDSNTQTHEVKPAADSSIDTLVRYGNSLGRSEAL